MKTEDVGLALRSMGALITGKEIRIFIEKYDPNRTGKVSQDDYINMLAEIEWKPDTEDDVKDAFSAFDKSGDGELSLDEMRHVLSKVGDTLTPEEAGNFLAALDTYGDGKGRMHELLKIIIPAEQQAVN